MIEELVAQNYGCLRDVRVELTPLHAQQFSAGLLYFLVFAALPELLGSHSLILLEAGMWVRAPRGFRVGTTLAAPHDEARLVGLRSVRGLILIAYLPLGSSKMHQAKLSSSWVAPAYL